mmetsp:Transcript_13259/g.24444  ORF Transcript_13259/g.24444 Transcript_13259/m.24444 type:complete len:151 (+) Transcript_13259:13-465(+)
MAPGTQSSLLRLCFDHHGCTKEGVPARYRADRRSETFGGIASGTEPQALCASPQPRRLFEGQSMSQKGCVRSRLCLCVSVSLMWGVADQVSGGCKVSDCLVAVQQGSKISCGQKLLPQSKAAGKIIILTSSYGIRLLTSRSVLCLRCRHH